MQAKYTQRIVVVSLLTGLLCSVCLEQKVLASEDRDFQVWHTAFVEKEWKGPWRVQFEEQVRFGNDVRRVVQHHTDFGLVYQEKDWIQIGGNFRYVLRKYAEDWEKESRPHLNVTFFGKWQGLDISNRNRLEYRVLSETRDAVRYRNKTQFELPVVIAKKTITPYVAEEIFLDFDQSEFNFNRVSFGIKFEINKSLDGDIYYLWQDDDGRGAQSPFNVLGTAVKIKF